jgi:hypothetical protein
VTIATINQQGQLVIASRTYGAASEINITGGTGRATLGLTVHDYFGVAGDLDGLTVLIDEDTTTVSTITFATPTNPADVATAVAAGTNLDADVYTSKSLLRVQSSTEQETLRLVSDVQCRFTASRSPHGDCATHATSAARFATSSVLRPSSSVRRSILRRHG